MIARSGLYQLCTRPIGVAAIALATIAVLAAIVPTRASAHTAAIGSQHSLNFVPRVSSGLWGQLSSETADCASGRSVTIYWTAASGDSAVATTSTGAQGGWWRQATGLRGGDYYAVAAASVVTSAGHKHTCVAARSNVVAVPPDGDGDGVSDPYDNCPGGANPSQQDSDGDWRGDACDDDADGDGYTAATGDCADNDRSRHPGRPDTTQNGIDDNCDGNVDEGFYAGIAYSDVYLRLIAQFPPGYADTCDVAVFLNPGGGTVCDATLDIVYFYPDGTLASWPWVLDPSSPTGWSIAPHPCDKVSEPADYETWSAYVDGTNYPELGIEIPSLSDEQIECAAATWGWWF
jgi:hypothetical protein